MSATCDSEWAADVLVIGGGGAALIAACRCRELGASVTLLSKKRPGVASCTAYAGGGFTAPLEQMPPEEYGETILRAGRGLNDRRMVEVMASEAESAFDHLQNWGVDFHRRRGSASVSGEIDNPLLRGTGLTFPLVRRAGELGVKMVHPFSVTSLLQEQPGAPVSGVRGVDAGGRVCSVRGRSVILATGGAGYLYGRTDNPAGITGDGYALALAAGSPLRDMEFVQFYPLGPAREGATWFMDTDVLDSLRLTDGNGEEFLPQLMQQWNLSSGAELNLYARDRLSVALQRRRQTTGSVILHLEEAGEDLRRDRECAHLAALMSGDRTDPWRPVEVAPVQHFFCGGIAADEWGATGVDNLYACGEVVGGAHGANRVGGNALTELMVFGLRSGEAAADNAGKISGGANPYSGDMFTPEGIDIGEIADVGPVCAGEPEWEYSFPRLRRAVDAQLGPARSGVGLQECLRWSAHLARSAWSTGRLPAVTALAIAASGLARQESRGCHWRDDYPEQGGSEYTVQLQPRPDSMCSEGRVRVNVARKKIGE